MKEQEVQKKIIKYLEGKGCYVVKVITANKSGVADLLFCKDGFFYACEVKAKGKKNTITKLQDHHLTYVKKTGGKAFVADCLEDVKKELGYKDEN